MDLSKYTREELISFLTEINYRKQIKEITHDKDSLALADLNRLQDITLAALLEIDSKTTLSN